MQRDHADQAIECEERSRDLNAKAGKQEERADRQEKTRRAKHYAKEDKDRQAETDQRAKR